MKEKDEFEKLKMKLIAEATDTADIDVFDVEKIIDEFKPRIIAQIRKEVAKEMTDKLFKKGTPENVRLMGQRVIEENSLTYIHIEYWNKDCKAFIGHTFNKPNDAIKFLIKETRRLNND